MLGASANILRVGSPKTSAAAENAPLFAARTVCGCCTVQDSVLRTTGRNLCLILLWYALSTGLSIYNKQLVGTTSGLFGRGAFPAPLFLSGVQFGAQAVIVRLVLRSGLIDRPPQKPRTWREYSIIGVPNGVVSGLDIGFSMKSLAFISMSFYTMCKSTVPVFLLLFAFIWRIERPSWELGVVVSVITVGLALLVRGEAHFHLLGFSLVMVASCFSGLRFTLTQLLLHGHHESLSVGGPLDVLELLTPIMSVTVLLLSLGWEQLWVALPASPYFATYQHTALSGMIILVGATLAFAMVWVEYKVIKETSALTFMMAGTCKEVFTVMAGVIVMGDSFGFINGVGLVIIILGVLLYNWHKYRRVRQGDVAPGRPAGKDHLPPGIGGSGGGATSTALPMSRGMGSTIDMAFGAGSRQHVERSESTEYEPLLPMKMDAMLSNG